MNLGVNSMIFTTSTASSKSGDDQFPVGLRVLAVDDDPICLTILEKMLRSCLYEVTKCSRAESALELLRDNKNGFDIVISDVHMPDMDGFKLLEHVGLEMDLPVIMLSGDDNKNVVMKGVVHGACDYMIKPVRIEALKNIWQHVVRKRKHEWMDKDFENSGSLEDAVWPQLPSDQDANPSSSANEGNSRKRKDEDDEVDIEIDEREDASTTKKPRVVWSSELHQQFVTAVNQLGIDKAVPKKILELMNIPGLTRENVASHLQKYRLYLRKLSGQHQNGLGNSFLGTTDLGFGSMATYNGIDLQVLASSGQIPPQSLATIQVAALARPTNKSMISMPFDQRNIFSFENPKIRFMEGQQQLNNNGSNKQMNLLHGIPTNMDSKQLAVLHQSSTNSFNAMNMNIQSQSSQCSSLLTPMIQPQSRAPILNSVVGSVRGPTYTPVSLRPNLGFSMSQRPEFLGNNFPLLSQSGITPPLSSKETCAPNYDVFNGVNAKRADDWGFDNSSSHTFEGFQHLNMPNRLEGAPSILIQPGFSSDPKNGNIGVPSLCNTTSFGQEVNPKSESLPNMGFQDQFDQEDLASVFLKPHQEGIVTIDNEFDLDDFVDLPISSPLR